ncbi:hypothetical protein COCSADRAFT_174953 [Bipolaris sorokiniana ND90Pr]|uniref:Uncharacterized protein n=1 Tax=Cochliobolus sativus (strain ND90Pr / ATCC 201652) TaxID=665912 RepID=M2SUF6_COCSN|nr:uncharacterized protein COCSADRAFT_174953 [Bipolaris sorokiniana ND90Pr]EMD60696.1 hypothetical protein COCSADRAFT_174953 [Bipolaris sorokiniana ND90Pr]
MDINRQFRLDHLRLVHSILCKFAPHRLLVASLGIPWIVCIDTFPQLRGYVEVCILVYHPEKALVLVETLCLCNNCIIELLNPGVVVSKLNSDDWCRLPILEPGYLHGLGHVHCPYDSPRLGAPSAHSVD